MRLRNGIVIPVTSKIYISPEFEIMPSRFDYRLGLKFKPFNYITLFSGYQTNRYSIGFGLNFSDFILNYTFQSNANKVKSEAVSTFGLTWNLGYNRKLRMNRYKNDKGIFDGYFNADLFDSATLTLDNIKTYLNEKKDADEYENVKTLIKQIKNSKALRGEMEENNQKILEQASLYIQENKFELAASKLENIEDGSIFYKKSLDLLTELDKRKNIYEKEQAEKERQDSLKVLLDSLNNTKDIFVKLNVLEQILKISSDQKYVKMKSSLEKAAENFSQQSQSLKSVNPDEQPFISRQNLFEIKKQRADIYYQNAVRYYEAKRYDDAKFEIGRGQKELNDFSWSADLLGKINSELYKIDKLNTISKSDMSNYNDAMKYFNAEDFDKALSAINKIVNRRPAVESLIKDINDSMRKSGKKSNITISKKISIEEANYMEQLFIEGKQAYIKEDLKTAREKWRKVLQIDPDNEKAKRYMKMVE